MSSNRITSLRRVLALYLTQERGAQLAMAQAVQKVAFLTKRFESLELRRISEPASGESDFVDTEALLALEVLGLMREETLRALGAARLEQSRYQREWMERFRSVEQVRGVLNLLQIEIDRTMQRHDQQEVDDFYAARKFSKGKSQP